MESQHREPRSEALEDDDVGTPEEPESEAPLPGRAVREALLPRNAPRLEGYEVAAGVEGAEEGRVAWDAFRLSEGRTVLAILSAQAGSALPSLHLAAARALLRGLAGAAEDAADLLARANEVLVEAAQGSLAGLVDCGLAIPGDGRVLWACAGRLPAVLVRRDGGARELGSHGPPLGMLGGFAYGADSLEVGAGDALLLLSRGTPGVVRGAGDLVARLRGRPVGDVVATVHRALARADRGKTMAETGVVFLRVRSP